MMTHCKAFPRWTCLVCVVLSIVAACMDFSLALSFPKQSIRTGWRGPDAEKLKSYNVNINDTSVSGLSSGGFFAVQMHVAFSENIRGSGIVAGGPYNCAQGQEYIATGTCVKGDPDVEESIETTNNYASYGYIDPVGNLQDDRVFLFSGTDDTTVVRAVVDALDKYYQHFLSNGVIRYISTLPAGHTQPTDDPNQNPCSITESPYISYCNFDGAGEALNTIYDDLKPRNDGTLSGRFIEFDQTEFIASGKSMATTGWMYVPKDCTDGSQCKLHVAFHGCEQTIPDIGYAYIKNTGFNKWADTNKLIILYPQVVRSYFDPTNPLGCWDWWGYNNANNYDTKTGDQMKAIKGMMDRIAKGFINVPSPTGLEVVNTTDSTVALRWNAVSIASGYNVYRNTVRVNSSPVTVARYVDTGLASGSTFTYFVRAVTSAGGESLPSASVTAKTQGNPPPIQPPSQVEVMDTTSNTVSLNWTAVNGAASYLVFRNGSLASQNPVDGTNFTDTGLNPETVYAYKLKSVAGNGGESGFSQEVDAKTQSSWTCQSFTASNYDHVQAGRAYQDVGYCYAVGSHQYMGLYNIDDFTTLAETHPDFYIIGTCPS